MKEKTIESYVFTKDKKKKTLHHKTAGINMSLLLRSVAVPQETAKKRQQASVVPHMQPGMSPSCFHP